LILPPTEALVAFGRRQDQPMVRSIRGTGVGQTYRRSRHETRGKRLGCFILGDILPCLKAA